MTDFVFTPYGHHGGDSCLVSEQGAYPYEPPGGHENASEGRQLPSIAVPGVYFFNGVDDDDHEVVEATLHLIPVIALAGRVGVLLAVDTLFANKLLDRLPIVGNLVAFHRLDRKHDIGKAEIERALSAVRRVARAVIFPVEAGGRDAFLDEVFVLLELFHVLSPFARSRREGLEVTVQDLVSRRACRWQA